MLESRSPPHQRAGCGNRDAGQKQCVCSHRFSLFAAVHGGDQLTCLVLSCIVSWRMPSGLPCAVPASRARAYAQEYISVMLALEQSHPDRTMAVSLEDLVANADVVAAVEQFVGFQAK